MAALEVRGLRKQFGGVVALNGIDLDIGELREYLGKARPQNGAALFVRTLIRCRGKAGAAEGLKTDTPAT